MAEDKGGFMERWQYRQEMQAHRAWDKWRFPTREEYAQFHDARNLADLAKTWLPNHVEAYGLGAHGLTPLLAEDKDRLQALLDKCIEEGLSESEVREYSQLYNRWQAEHSMLAGEEGQAPSAERAQIEANTERLKQEVQYIGERAAERAYYIPQDGLNIGDKGNKLFTGGAGDWGAPKIHPVWAPAVAYEARTAERMGAATFEYEPQYRKLEEWAAAGKPEIRAEEDIQSLKARMEALAGPRPEVIADRLADVLEEAQRQGLVVTGHGTGPETPQPQHKQGVRY
jgi:hypothetical protein